VPLEATGIDGVGMDEKLVTLALVQALQHSADGMHSSGLLGLC